ncbi:MAG: transcriptional regulator BetI [Enterobacteriaceae bacterium]
MSKRKEIKQVRRLQLIRATLSVIEKVGLADTTIALIAEEAGLSTGIISHYFGDKNGLLYAVMRQIMQDLRNESTALESEAGDDTSLSPVKQLQKIIDANLSVQQTDSAVVKSWLSFWAASMHQPGLRRLNRVNERRLYSNLYYYFACQLPADKARTAAIGLAAMIEGLWLRIALTDGELDIHTARTTAYHYLHAQLLATEGVSDTTGNAPALKVNRG